MEKSYLEIKVTFIHIFVLLIAIILIGIFLFYLGYQAGRSSLKSQTIASKLQNDIKTTEEIKITEETSKAEKQKKQTMITEEMKLHDQSAKQQISKKEKINGKPIQKKSYYSIQVGAFLDQSNAKKYADKFIKLGYPTEILSTIKEKKKLFRVRVGNFPTLKEAKKEKTKLEKMEKSKFTIAKSG